jgi:hypothetical protein
MNSDKIIETLESHKGQNLRAKWRKPLKTRKGVEDVIEKETQIIVRGGVDYDNIGVVQEKRENGELPTENAGLPWGQWKKFPIIIEHKEQEYARLYPASGINFPVKTKYFFNGIEVPKDEVKEFCLKSEFPEKDEAPLCYTVKVNSIVELGN